MRKPELLLKEYFGKISDYDLVYIHSRLINRIGGDLAEALNFLSRQPEIDRWLNSAGDHNQFYDMLDVMGRHSERECSRRRITV